MQWQFLIKDDTIASHVPYNVAPQFSHFLRSDFLRRDLNKAFAEVTGGKVNRRAGYGLEVPCVYGLYGPKVYIDKMNELMDSVSAAGLL